MYRLATKGSEKNESPKYFTVLNTAESRKRKRNIGIALPVLQSIRTESTSGVCKRCKQTANSTIGPLNVRLSIGYAFIYCAIIDTPITNQQRINTLRCAIFLSGRTSRDVEPRNFNNAGGNCSVPWNVARQSFVFIKFLTPTQ